MSCGRVHIQMTERPIVCEKFQVEPPKRDRSLMMKQSDGCILVLQAWVCSKRIPTYRTSSVVTHEYSTLHNRTESNT